MTLTEKLFKENESAFEKIKPQLIENVMTYIKKYGHHNITFTFAANTESIKKVKWYNGEETTDIHPLLVRHAEKYLREQGFSVYVDTHWRDNSIKQLNITL